MANYYGSIFTDWFKVTDEGRYEFLFKGLSGEDNIEDYSERDGADVIHRFASFSTLTWHCPFGYHLREFMKIFNPYKDSPKVFVKDFGSELQIDINEVEDLDTPWVVGFCRTPSELVIIISEEMEDDDENYDFDNFLDELQLILPTNETINLYEHGHDHTKYHCDITNKLRNWEVI